MTYSFPALSDDPSCCCSCYFDVRLQLHFLFGAKEVLLLQLTVYSALSLKHRGLDKRLMYLLRVFLKTYFIKWLCKQCIHANLELGLRWPRHNDHSHFRVWSLCRCNLRKNAFGMFKGCVDFIEKLSKKNDDSFIEIKKDIRSQTKNIATGLKWHESE